MHVYYEEGPPSVTMGAAGTFQRGVSRDIDDKLADGLLKKKTVVFKSGVKPDPEKPAAPAAMKPKQEVTINGAE